jgi:glyceraldehyde 3-phosphate dehydrogenase
VGKPITIFDSVEIAKVVLSLDLPPSKLDIGKLTYEYILEMKSIQMKTFCIDKLKKLGRLKKLCQRRGFIWFW